MSSDELDHMIKVAASEPQPFPCIAILDSGYGELCWAVPMTDAQFKEDINSIVEVEDLSTPTIGYMVTGSVTGAEWYCEEQFNSTCRRLTPRDMKFINTPPQ